MADEKEQPAETAENVKDVHVDGSDESEEAPAPSATGPEFGDKGESSGFDESADRDEDGLPGGVRERIEAFVPDLVRRTFAAGLGALFTTEEGIRKITREVPMPKEVAGYLASTASTTKDEVLRIIAREVREFLETVNLSDEIAKMLTTLSFEIKTEIRFIPNDEKYGGVEPDVKAKVRLKRKTEGPLRSRLRRKTNAPPEEDKD